MVHVRSFPLMKCPNNETNMAIKQLILSQSLGHTADFLSFDMDLCIQVTAFWNFDIKIELNIEY